MSMTVTKLVHKRAVARQPKTPYAHFRDVPSVLFRPNHIHRDFRRFIRNTVLPCVVFRGYKCRQKQRVAMQCVFTVYEAFLQNPDKVIADNRDKSKNYLRIQIWDALEQGNLVRKCIGCEASHKVTRYKATGILLKILQQYGGPMYDYNLARNTQRKIPTDHALVVLHTGTKDLATGEELPEDKQKQPVPLQNLRPHIIKQVADAEDRTEYRNQVNLKHQWLAYQIDEDTGERIRFAVNPCDRQTHSGLFLRCQRLSSWGVSVQSLPKTMRRLITIDGEAVTELDFSAFDLRRYYHYRGIDPNPYEDLYKPELVFPKLYKGNFFRGGKKIVSTKDKNLARDFVKTVTNTLFNTKTLRAAYAATLDLSNKHEKKGELQRILRRERIYKPSEIVKRIIAVHPDIKDDFFRKIPISNYSLPIGNSIMTLGTAILEEILWQFAINDKPATGIHDAILCKASDGLFARKTMAGTYQKWCLGFRPVIKKVF